MEWNWLDQHKVQSVQSSHTLHTGRILTGLGPWLWSSTSRFPFRGGNSSSECYLYLFMLIKPCCALSVLQSKNTHTHTHNPCRISAHSVWITSKVLIWYWYIMMWCIVARLSRVTRKSVVEVPSSRVGGMEVKSAAAAATKNNLKQSAMTGNGVSVRASYIQQCSDMFSKRSSKQFGSESVFLLFAVCCAAKEGIGHNNSFPAMQGMQNT